MAPKLNWVGVTVYELTDETCRWPDSNDPVQSVCGDKSAQARANLIAPSIQHGRNPVALHARLWFRAGRLSDDVRYAHAQRPPLRAAIRDLALDALFGAALLVARTGARLSRARE